MLLKVYNEYDMQHATMEPGPRRTAGIGVLSYCIDRYHMIYLEESMYLWEYGVHIDLQAAGSTEAVKHR